MQYLKSFTWHILSVLLVMISTIANAQTISEDRAHEYAKTFLESLPRTYSVTRLGSTSLTLAHRATHDGNICYYVYNQSGGGYVIIGGDESARKILGWSQTGTFDYNNMPDNMRWWLTHYEKEISNTIQQIRAGKLKLAPETKSAKTKAADTHVSIAPLLKVGDTPIQWNQGKPYNYAIDGGYGNFVTGCVATAGAQVMRYHAWPNTDRNLRYETKILAQSQSGDLYSPAITNDYTYNWNKMFPQYNANLSFNDENVRDMAELLYRIGRSIDAKYGTNETSASTYDLGKSLIEHFDYDPGLLYRERSYYSDAEWEQMIYNELSAQRPVIYSGQDLYSNSGHAFVCDGYDASNDAFHINWGWGGYCDNYFALTGTGALAPDGSGTGGAGMTAAYSREQAVITGIQRNLNNDYAIILGAEPFSYESDEVISNTSITLKGRFSNLSYANFNRYLGFIIKDVDNDAFQYIATYNYGQELQPRYGFTSIKLRLPSELAIGHRYSVCPVYSNIELSEDISKAEWIKAQMPADYNLPIFTLIEGEPVMRAASSAWAINSSANIAPGSLLSTNGTLWIGNLGERTETFNIGFKFTNTSDPADVTYTGVVKTFSINPNYRVGSQVSFLIPATLSIGATYAISVVYQDRDGQWTETERENNYTLPTITTVEPQTLVLASDPEVSNNGYFTPEDLCIKLRVLNRTNETKNTGTISIIAYTGNSTKGAFTLSPVNIPAGDEHEFEVKYNNFSFNQGQHFTVGEKYYFQIRHSFTGVESNYNVANPIQLCNTRNVNFTMTNAEWSTLCLPYDAEVPYNLYAYSINEIDANGNLVMEEVDRLKMNCPYLISGKPGQYTFTGPDTPYGNYVNGLLTGITTIPDAGNEIYAPQGSFILQNQSAGVGFYQVQNANSQKLRTCSAYLKVPATYAVSPNTSFNLRIKGTDDDIETAIVNINEPVLNNENYDQKAIHSNSYDLSGRHVNRKTRGLIISNGQIYFQH